MSARNRSMLSAIPLAAFLFTGCEIGFVDQEVQLRWNEADGSADLLILYRGLTATREDPETIQKALADVGQVLEGRRQISIPDLGILLDLDDPATYRDIDPETSGVLQGITIESLGVFLDDEKRLSGFQLLHLPDPEALLRCLNRCLSDDIRSGLERGACDGDPPILDERSKVLLLERARSGDPWISFEGGAFAVDLPMTRASWEKIHRQVIDFASRPEKDSNPGMLLTILLHLSSLEIGDERIRLTFGAPVSGIFQLGSHHPEIEYHPGLLEALRAVGIEPEEGLTLEETRALLSPPPDKNQ